MVFHPPTLQGNLAQESANAEATAVAPAPTRIRAFHPETLRSVHHVSLHTNLLQGSLRDTSLPYTRYLLPESLQGNFGRSISLPCNPDLSLIWEPAPTQGKIRQVRPSLPCNAHLTTKWPTSHLPASLPYTGERVAEKQMQRW
jgi:hypothetical protein